MKGLVFVELLKMADATLGEAVVDHVLDTTPLNSGGAYTAVGYYDCSELILLVDEFSKVSGIERPELERKFAHCFMESLLSSYPEHFAKHGSAFDMLESIESDIHAEVRKLYPDAELPTFSTLRLSATDLEMTYKSARPLAHFCYGMIEACLKTYGENAVIKMTDNPAVSGDTVFLINKE